MHIFELTKPFFKALTATKKSAVKIVLWSSVAAFFELCMLAAFIPLIGVATNQPIPEFFPVSLSRESFITSYSVFLLFFILAAILLIMYVFAYQAACNLRSSIWKPLYSDPDADVNFGKYQISSLDVGKLMLWFQCALKCDNTKGCVDFKFEKKGIRFC